MPIEQQVFHAFTTKISEISNVLINEVTIIYNESILTGKALWDTGATGSCISTEVAEKLSMSIAGKTFINTPSGKKEVNRYVVDVELPNRVRIKDVFVCDSDIGAQGIDMLIGMDIISFGDFAVSNYNGKTTFTFRTPSKECTDYVKEINISNLIGQKHGKGKRKKH